MNHADKAAVLVLGDRNTDYGTPADDFEGTALIWSGILSAKLKDLITPQEVALMMAGLKLRRHAHRPKDDNIIDAHGYLLCLEWIETGRKPTTAADAANQTIEDVCCGARMKCDKCGGNLPCSCDYSK